MEGEKAMIEIERYVNIPRHSMRLEYESKEIKVRNDVPMIIYREVEIKYKDKGGKDEWNVQDSGKGMESIHTSLTDAKKFIDEKLTRPNIKGLNIPVYVGFRVRDHYEKAILTSISPDNIYRPYRRDNFDSAWIRYTEHGKDKRELVSLRDIYSCSKENKTILHGLAILDGKRKKIELEEKRIRKVRDEEVKKLIRYSMEDKK